MGATQLVQQRVRWQAGLPQVIPHKAIVEHAEIRRLGAQLDISDSTMQPAVPFLPWVVDLDSFTSRVLVADDEAKPKGFFCSANDAALTCHE